MDSNSEAKMKRKRREEDERVVQQKGYTYGDGVAWYRGAMLGKGSFGSVYLANLKKPRSKYGCYPSFMAVKSAEISVSGSIQKEMEVLNNVKGCPNIIRCFGEETTTGGNGLMAYNILLEYGSGGTLIDRIKKTGSKGLSEFEVRCYTKSILKGLKFIHELGYVHCDLKPDNILLVGKSTPFAAKIADFGLAKREKQCKKIKLESYWRGTPIYLSPEVVIENVQKQPSDIWAVGCIVLEMLTGKPPWDSDQKLTADEILEKIREGKELPKIPNGLSKEAKDFLKGCFVRKSMYRLTAEMLLCHEFVEGSVYDTEVDDEVEDVDEDVNDIEDDWSSTSDDEYFTYYSEEEFEFEDVFCEDESLNLEERNAIIIPMIDAEYDPTDKDSARNPSKLSLNKSGQCQVNFTISAGV